MTISRDRSVQAVTEITSSIQEGRTISRATARAARGRTDMTTTTTMWTRTTRTTTTRTSTATRRRRSNTMAGRGVCRGAVARVFDSRARTRNATSTRRREATTISRRARRARICSASDTDNIEISARHFWLIYLSLLINNKEKLEID
jgi:hypothetical protein